VLSFRVLNLHFDQIKKSNGNETFRIVGQKV